MLQFVELEHLRHIFFRIDHAAGNEIDGFFKLFSVSCCLLYSPTITGVAAEFLETLKQALER